MFPSKNLLDPDREILHNSIMNSISDREFYVTSAVKNKRFHYHHSLDKYIC